MRSCWASIWFLSMSILTSLTAPLASLTTFSIIGWSVLQGPHHGAQKSTMTGTVREASITSLANLVWSLSLMRSAGAACGAAPFSIVSMGPRRGEISGRPQCGPHPSATQGGGRRGQRAARPAASEAPAVQRYAAGVVGEEPADVGRPAHPRIGERSPLDLGHPGDAKGGVAREGRRGIGKMLEAAAIR